MIKNVAVGIMFCLIIILSGCEVSDSNKELATPDKLAKQQSEAIIEAVVNEDKEALKKMFCQYIKDNHDLEDELDVFFKSIYGKIVSYDEPYGTKGFVSTTENGINIMKLKGYIDNVKTDTGKVYKISFNSYQKYVENEEYIGMCYISVRDKNGNEEGIKIGEVMVD